MSRLSDWVMSATPEELQAADWRCVHAALRKAQAQFEEHGAGRQSWLDPYIAIAAGRGGDVKITDPAPAPEGWTKESVMSGDSVPTGQWVQVWSADKVCLDGDFAPDELQWLLALMVSLPKRP